MLTRAAKVRRIAFYSLLITSIGLLPLYPAIELHAASYGPLIPLPDVGAWVAPIGKSINSFFSRFSFSNTSTQITKPSATPAVNYTLSSQIQVPTPPKPAIQPSPIHIIHPDFTTNVGGFGIYRSHMDMLRIFSPGNKTFSLYDSNNGGNPYVSVPYGTGSGTFYPVVGDWNNDGVETIGVFNNGQFQLQDTDITASSSPDHTVTFGNPTDRPLAGKWDTNVPYDSVGVFRPSNGLVALSDSLSSPSTTYSMIFGNPGDVALTGDWNGDSYDSAGVYRPSTSTFYLTDTNCNCTPTTNYTSLFGNPGSWVPFSGDWTNKGTDGIGLFDAVNHTVYLKNALTSGNADITLNNIDVSGSSSDLPVAGHWGNIFGKFFKANQSDTSFTATPGSTPAFEEGFPNFSFNPDPSRRP